ncbi:hypothetical protein ACFVMC_12265 [Nocardia sp. NPDC127579]|uniref:hypothetical protein n=1 Tax=Nocardia sp. NPDC127579 TaxID=3345402 RepID=UPI0036257BA0
MRLTPQEKKAYSYAKDRRNTYGENDKASRKNLPRKRARVHRANRQHDAQLLSRTIGPVDAEHADTVEQRVLGWRRKRFQKWRDTALGEYVTWQLERRAES